LQAVIRNYGSNAELADELVKREGDVEELIRGVQGFVAYYLVKTPTGTASISVFEDAAGAEESTRRAAAFVKENVAAVAGAPPEVIEGETVIHFVR
jgi:hypothetical protein